MPATPLIRRVLLAAALTGIAGYVPAAVAADEPVRERPAAGTPDAPPRERTPEPRRPEGERPRGERPPGGDRQDPAAMIERMKAEFLAMDLTAEQKTQVEEIFAKAKDDMAAHRQQAEGKEPAERMEGARAILQAMREKLGGILNDEQRQAMRQRMERAREGAGQGLGMMSERIKGAMSGIDLNAEQKQKLDALLAENQTKMQEINEQTRTKIRELMTDTRSKIDALLTPEQREKFQQALPEGGPARGSREGGERRRTEPPADRL